jgi:hypothetical protein
MVSYPRRLESQYVFFWQVASLETNLHTHTKQVKLQFHVYEPSCLWIGKDSEPNDSKHTQILFAPVVRHKLLTHNQYQDVGWWYTLPLNLTHQVALTIGRDPCLDPLQSWHSLPEATVMGMLPLGNSALLLLGQKYDSPGSWTSIYF